ncbi:MAG: transposase [Syntrophales bacterium]
MEESWAGVFREHILRELPVQKIAPYFSEGSGRPTKELYAALGGLILQQMHDLTDEETVEEFCFNIKWHYALDIPGESDESKYLSLKTLWTLRHLVMAKGLDIELFNRTTELLAKAFRVDASRQRIDSVHIRSNMKRLGRLGIFSRGIHVFLVNLKRQRPEIFETIDKELVDRYLTQKALSCFSLVKPSESGKTLEMVARDLFSLVRRFRENREVNSLHSYNTLVRVLKDQCRVTEEQDNQPAGMEVKSPKEVSSASLQNPSDPDAGYSGHKGQGYHAQVMETYCDSEEKEVKERTLNLITHVEVEPAHVSDAHALIPALESAKERGFSPEEVLADSLYGSDENGEKAKEMGVEIISPAMGTPNGEALNLSDFTQTENGKIAACPQGHTPVRFKQGKKNTCSVAFDSEHCDICPLRERCPVKPGRKRHYLRFDLKTLRIAARRTREHTPEFNDKYRWRSGIESTFSGMDKQTGIKHLRVRGLAAVGYCARLKAIGVNLFRAARVKRVLDTLNPVTGVVSTFICSIVKEHFLSPCRQLSGIFKSAIENIIYTVRIAA